MPQAPIPNILSILTFLPLVGAIIIMMLKRPQDLPDSHGGHDHAHDAPAEKAPVDPARKLVNTVAVGFALVNFVLSLILMGSFQSSYTNAATRNMQFMEQANWISLGKISIQYHFGVDGISLLLIVLTTFLMLLCVGFSTATKQRLKEFMVFLLFLETGMIGVFCALDLVLFYIFWEAMLIPMYFLIGIFGHERRIYAAIKFFLYTFAGSVFMLIAIVAVYQVAGTFNVLDLSNPLSAAGAKLHGYNPQMLMWMFGAFALAFMIKVPMFPFHTWLPDAHVEAPTAGSVILAGVMLKMGTYGFIRFCLPMFPAQAVQSSNIFIILAVVGIVYGSLVAAVQTDAKKLVAYSSVAHLGFAVLGIFTFTRVGMMGALLQNISHGLSTPMLFFIVGMLYERRHTRAISEFGGLKKVTPMLATMLLIATLASVAVPFFSGFVGEFPVLLGSWVSDTAGMIPTAIAATGMILSAVYMLWWFQRLMLGPVTKTANQHLPDMTRNEWLVLTPLAAMVFFLGINSTFWTSRMDSSVDALLPVAEEHISSELPIGERHNLEGLKARKEDKNHFRPAPVIPRHLTPEERSRLSPGPPAMRGGAGGGPGGSPGGGPPGGGLPGGRMGNPGGGPPGGRPGGGPGGMGGGIPGRPGGGVGGPGSTPPGGSPNGRGGGPGGPPLGGPPGNRRGEFAPEREKMRMVRLETEVHTL